MTLRKHLLTLAISAALSAPLVAHSATLPNFDIKAAAAKRGDRAQPLPASAFSTLKVADGLRWMQRELPSSERAKVGSASAAAATHLRLLAGEQGKSVTVLSNLRWHSESALPNGAAIVKYDSVINGVEVFRESVALLIGHEQQLVALRGALPEAQAASRKRTGAATISARDAVALALTGYGFDRDQSAARLTTARVQGDYTWFAPSGELRSASGAEMQREARAKAVWFRRPDQGLVAAWYVETQIAPRADAAAEYYAQVFDASSGELLFRMFQQADAEIASSAATAPDGLPGFTYRVWADTAPNRMPLPDPHGRNNFPVPTAAPGAPQPPFVAQGLFTLSNAPFSHDTTDGWLPGAATETTGNNTDAYLDLTTPDGFNAGDLRPTTSSPGTFNYTFDTAINASANNTQRMAASIQQFYWVNWLHDWFYDSGFAEVDGNAQTDNFSRGGLGNDAIRAEGQDVSGRNNANMATPADGAPPRMQMFLFDGPSINNFTYTPPGATVATNTAGGFGAQSFNITGAMVRALDAGTGPTTFDGCTALTNAAAVAGKIAMVDRGACNFSVKAKNAQNAGAIGVLIGNVASSGNPETPPGMGGTDATVTVGVLSVGFSDAEAIRTQIGNGPTTGVLRRDPAIERDGTIDGLVISHEWGHYISNRLVENASGLSTNHAGGLGEGWADFNALLSLVKDEDRMVATNTTFNGAYAEGEYAGADYFRGIRRYPYSTSFAINPLTLQHIVNGVALPASPAPGFGANGANNAEVHNTGEVWASALWQCYAALLNDSPRLSFDQAQSRMKAYVVGGYKLTPAAPTFIEARDAVLATAFASDPADFALCANAFASRGAGLLAEVPDRFSATNAGTVEDFTFGGNLATQSLLIDDAVGGCDNDGIPDLGETVDVGFNVANSGWIALSASSATASADHPGVAFPGAGGDSTSLAATQPFATVNGTVSARLNSQPASGLITLTVTPTDPAIASPPGTSSALTTFTNVDERDAQSSTDTFNVRTLGWATLVEAGAPPSAAWTREHLGGSQFVAHGPDFGSTSITSLISPDIQVANGQNLVISFSHRYAFEPDATINFDGGVIEISINGGATWTDIGNLANPGYGGDLDSGNPLGVRPAFVQQSAGYPAFLNASINLGSSFAGQTVKIRFVVGSDGGVGAAGWDLDSVHVQGASNTPFPALVPEAALCIPGQSLFGDGFE